LITPPKRTNDFDDIVDEEEMPVIITAVEKCKKAVKLMGGRRPLNKKDAAQTIGVDVTMLQR
jgi:hypothetical protein